MSKAEEYNLHFIIHRRYDETVKPSIGVSLVNGESKNYEIASFLESNGVKLTQEIIDQINSFDYNHPFEDYNVWGYHDAESVEIKNPPATAVFNTGGIPVEIPIADFIQILQEWKTFLQTIPNPHWLSNR